MEKTTLRGILRPVIRTKYYSGGQINRMRWVGHAAHMGKRRGAYRVLVEKPEGKRPLGGSRLDNIEWTFKKWDVGTDWIGE